MRGRREGGGYSGLVVNEGGDGLGDELNVLGDNGRIDCPIKEVSAAEVSARLRDRRHCHA